MIEHTTNRRRRKNLYFFQIGWIVTAIIATIVIIICSKKLLSFGKQEGLDEFYPQNEGDLLEDMVSDTKDNGNIGENNLPPENNDSNNNQIILGDDSSKDKKENTEDLEDKNSTEDKNKTEDTSVKDKTDKEETISGEDSKDNSTKSQGKKENSTEEDNKNQTDKNQTNSKQEDKTNQKEDDKQIDDTKKLVAFTFDDGPNPTVTDRILKVLEENDAKATFFVMGNRMSMYPETVKKIYESGNQLGNHTYSHKDLTKLKAEGIKDEVAGSNDCITEIVPAGDVPLRPPYGNRNDLLSETIKVPMILWSVDSLDWKSRNKDAVIKEVLNTIRDGDIVLMHDLYSTTADAVEYLIPYLIEQGYEFVTVSELFERRGIELEAGEAYYRARPVN